MSLVTPAAGEDDVRRPRGRSDGDRREHVDKIYNTFADLPPDRFPLLTSHAAQMVAGDSVQRFRYAIDVVLDGMLARATRQ